MTITVGDLPDVKLNASGRGFRQTQQLTRPNLEFVLADMGLVCRYDMMRGVIAYEKNGARVPPELEEAAYNEICDELTRVDINGHGRLDSLVSAIAQGDKFHPMEDWLKGLTWDGVDRIEQLADTIVTDTRLWPVFLENWLVQTVAGVCGWRGGLQSLPHVLVLVGGQGRGKTNWLARLGGEWIKTEAELHLSSPAGKDHQIEALKYPMVELSELSGIFRKSDIDHMKSFLSRTFDAIRSPYARTAVQRPRVTSFCGSVNEAAFLTDPTGSRRFWPVNVEHITWDFEMNFGQLWAQAYNFWQQNSDFSLTPDEENERARIAVDRHTEPCPEVEFLAAFYDAHKHLRKSYRPMNGAEIMRMLGYRNCWNRTISEAKQYISKVCGPPRTIDGKQRSWNFPYADNATDMAAWPRPISLKSVK